MTIFSVCSFGEVPRCRQTNTDWHNINHRKEFIATAVRYINKAKLDIFIQQIEKIYLSRQTPMFQLIKVYF